MNKWLILLGLLLLGLVFLISAEDIYYDSIFLIHSNEGNLTINEIVEDTAIYGNNPERLTFLAEGITRDFSDPYFPNQMNEKYFCNYTSTWGWCVPNYSFFNKNPFNCTYAVDKSGRVRVMKQNYLTLKPTWIAYQKTGACQELSIYFYTVANRSGFTARIVHSYGISHYWNEVLLNGEWKFFDSQTFAINENKIDTNKWFGNRSKFSESTNFNKTDLVKSGIFVFDPISGLDIENVTEAYME